ncbi:chromosome segregation protein SMC [Enterococcus casseliflavus]|nr:chromosome segregation protein SMC [Enterococcus casseliflavus]
MLATSEEIQAAWLNTSRQLSIRLKMNDITYGSEEITSLSFNSGSISGEVFQIGSTPLNSVQVVFPTIIETVKEDLEIEPELGILINGEYQFTKLGHFFITDFERDRNSNKTTITANDKMIYMEGIYESKLTYPKPYREVALEIANLAGVEIDQASFASLGTEWVQKPVGYTFRQAIGLIAQFEGGFASFNRKGELTIKRLAPTNFEITPESYMLKGFTKNENSYRIGGITVKTGEEETDVIRVGSTNGSQVELENKVMTQTHLNQMWELVKTLNYFPYELKWRGSPILEAGDWIYILDKDGTRYSVPNLSYNITFNGGMSAESKANTNSSSQATYRYRGPLNQRVDYVESLLSANKWNSNYYDQTEPIDPKEGDIWFKPNGVDTEIWVYEKNSSGELDWVFKVSTATDPDLVKEIEQAKQAGENAQEAADQAKADAQSAQAKADKIQIDVNGLVSDVTTINGTVNSISSKANEAYNKANAVESRTATLETSVTGLTGRITDVESATTSTTKKLNELVVTVDGQKQTIATVTTTANSALNKANVLESTVDGVMQTLTSVEEWQNDFYIGARNWVSESEAPKFRAYKSAIITYTTVSVPEWNATNAVRHVVTGGTGTICGTLPGNIITYVKDNTDYVHSMYVKNNGDKRVTFNNNLSQSVVVEPGETKRIVMKAHHNVNLAAMQFVLYRPANTDSLDFTVWRAQIEEGVALSDWSPAPEDKAQTTKVNQIESTVEGTIQTVASVKNTADSALSKATQVETTANGLKTTISRVETTANSALTKATQVEATANGLTSTVSEMNTTAVNTDWKGRVAGALQLSADPTFLKGSNNLIPYNNTAGGSVVLTRQNIPLSSGGTQPTGSAYRMMIETKGPSSPALGGFYYRLDARVNAKFIIRFIANIPNGRTLYHAHNQIGDGSSVRWLTPRQGTGTWSEYAYLVQCGTGGTFSTFGFQYIQSVAGDNPTPEAPFRWYVAKFEVFDITNSNQSQITQLSDTINLKVSKNDVINQINISTDGVLIAGNKVQITGQTYIEDGVIGRAQIANLAVSTAQIADAAITDAKIGSLSATKITTGTLNAANVNIINLNASSIVSGTLNAIDLTGGKITQSDSGEYSMELLKGSIYFRRSTNELARIQPIYVSKEPVGLAIVQMPGEVFSINTGSATDTTSMPIFQIPDTSSRTNMEWKMYGVGNVDAVVNFNNTVNAKLRFVSTNTVEARRIVTGKKDTYVMQLDGNNYLSIEGEYGVRIKHNQAGTLYTPIEARYNNTKIATTTTINLNVTSGANMTLKTDRLELNNGGDSYYSNAPAGVTLGMDSTPRIWSMAIYNRTYSSASNMFITSAGTIGRSTSARKYKEDIQVADEVISKAKRFLSILPSSWYDKAEIARGGKAQRYYGFVADDFDVKGLKEVVLYGSSGQVEGLAYDRLTMYQNVILSDHEREIQSLKNEVDQLKTKVKELEAA